LSAISRLRLVIALILILGFLLAWQFGGRQATETTSVSDPRQRVDWFVEQALLTRYDENGARISATDAPRVTHYDGRQESHIDNPYSVGFQPDQSVSHTLKADRAIHPDDNSQLALSGNVELQHKPDTEQAVAIFTPTLTYFPETKLALTADPVQINTSSGETTAVGMEFYTAERRMELLSTVRGTYVGTQSEASAQSETSTWSK